MDRPLVPPGASLYYTLWKSLRIFRTGDAGDDGGCFDGGGDGNDANNGVPESLLPPEEPGLSLDFNTLFTTSQLSLLIQSSGCAMELTSRAAQKACITATDRRKTAHYSY